MYRFFLVSDATSIATHADIYAQRELFWDPKSESESYAISEPKLKEELNKASSLEFVVLPTNIHYNDFHRRKTVVLAYDENELLFEGYVTAAPVDFFKQRRVVCSGTMAYLCDSVQAPDEKNQIVVPVSSSEIWYMPVPTELYHEANPVQNEWYEQEIVVVLDELGEIVYTEEVDDQGNPIPLTEFTGNYILTADTEANYEKYYFYKTSGDGRNYSGKLTTKLAAKSETISDHITRYLDVHNAQMNPFKTILPGTLHPVDSEKHDFQSASYRATWDGFKTDIIDEYGRYISVKPRSDGNLYLDYLDLTDMDGGVKPVIEFARNMLEMNEEDDSDDDFFSVLLPIGKDKLTIEKADFSKVVQVNTDEVAPYAVEWGGKKQYIVVSDAAVQRYGYVVRTQSFDDVSDATKLYNRAVEYIQNNYDYHNEYNVKAIDLKIIDSSVTKRITVGNKCRLLSAWHEVDEQDLYVISAEYDLVNPENDTFKIGIPTQDREAKNRTLTGQHNKTKSNTNKNGASSASASANLAKRVDDVISVTEWGLESQTRIANEVKSEIGKNATRFEQDEYHIRLYAQKLFGEQDDDAGFIPVPSDKLVDKNGNPKNPRESHWYEYNETTNKYELTKDTYQHPEKTYYIQNLYTRTADIEVGEGGIHERVNGNYLNSTYCSSWIESNETSILALTGNLYVDPDGQVVINSGSGLRTGHKQTVATAPKYYQVSKVMYADNPNPSAKMWYERKLDKTGAWLGEGKEDKETNSAYYVLTEDTEVNRSKHYYYNSSSVEEFHVDYGIYDENNLTAGVVARAINNPTYTPVSQDEINMAKIRGQSPGSLGWYEEDSETGLMGISLDSSPSFNKKYFHKINNIDDYTDIWGKHIVIGKTSKYEELDDGTKEKIDTYCEALNLDGTITEIASDVVTINALFAKYIHFDVGEGDYLTIDNVYSERGTFDDHVYVGTSTDDGELHVWGSVTVEGEGFIQADDIYITNSLSFGSENYIELDEEKLSNIVTGFGTITTVGDTVNIPYMNAGMDNFDEEHVLSFEKPASINKAVWSSGSGGVHDLKVYTVGGWNGGSSPQWACYHAQVTYPTNFLDGAEDSGGNARIVYKRTGSSHTNNGNMATSLNNKPTIKAHMELSGEDWNKNGINVGLYHEDSFDDMPVIPGWSKYIFIDATDAYEDGWGHAESQMDFPPVMQGLVEVTRLNFKFPSKTPGLQDQANYYLRDDDTKGSTGYVRVYRNYVDSNNKGLLVGAINVGDWYSTGWGNAENQMDFPPAMQGLAEVTRLNFKFPSKTVGSQDQANYYLRDDDPKGSTGYVRVYRNYVDSNNKGLLVGAINVGDWYTEGYETGIEYAKGKIGVSDVAVGSADNDGERAAYNAATTLSYGTTYMYYATYDGSRKTSKKYFKTPADNYVAPGTPESWYKRWNSGDSDYVWNIASNDTTLNLSYDETIYFCAYNNRGSGQYDSGKTITVKSPSDRYETGIIYAKGKIGVSDVAVGSADNDGERAAYNAATTLSYGTTYMYYATYNGSRQTSKKYFKTPANNSTTHSISIPTGDIDVSTTEPSGTKLTTLKSAINEAIRDKKWLYFKVKCGTSTKQYYFDFTS